MRFLHTADWHLGRSFHGEPLLSQQAGLLDWIVAVAREEAVDAVIVAGDLYDRALPPTEAVELAGETLQRLAEDGRQVVVISGNHDSAARLSFAAGLLSRAGLHFRTDPLGCGLPVVVGGVAIYGIPYLEPESVAGRLGCEERTHEAVLTAAMEQIRAARGGQAEGGRGGQAAAVRARPPGMPCIVAAHAFIAGGRTADSEREIAVGGAAQVGARRFDGVDYLALGHLHRPQATGPGRYAGSPLPYSFSEAADVKSVVVGELGASGELHAELLPCPVPRRLVRVRGTLEELLLRPELREHEDAWVEATLTDPVRPLEGMAQLQRRFPHAVCLLFDPQGGGPRDERSYAERLKGLSEEEILERFVRDVRGSGATPEELALLVEALGAGRAREAVG